MVARKKLDTIREEKSKWDENSNASSEEEIERNVKLNKMKTLEKPFKLTAAKVDEHIKQERK